MESPAGFLLGKGLLDFSVESNVRQFKRGVSETEKKQIPFAIAVALTRTAMDATKNQKKRLPRVLDRPTPFTLRGVMFKKATKRNLVSSVYFKDIQAQYLWQQEHGGVRWPKGRAIVVPVGVSQNKYGNMTRNRVKQLRARADTFSGVVRGVAGLWQRRKRGGVKLLVRYHKRAHYRARLGFEMSVPKTFAARFPVQLDRSFKQAVDNAR